MYSYTAVALAAMAAVPSVYAHGHIASVSGPTASDENGTGKDYSNTDRPGWYAENGDNGFVDAANFNTADMACHNQATPGTTDLEVTAGDTLTIQWDTWPESHHGPVIDMMARCDNGCQDVTAEELFFFKIAEQGLIDGTKGENGYWASDKLIENGNTWEVTIPSSLTGTFVLRHEIIALHSAGSIGGAQNYPQCINLNVVGGGDAHPCDSGAPCAHGADLYVQDGPGIVYDGLYNKPIADYTIPGIGLWQGATGAAKRFARSFVA